MLVFISATLLLVLVCQTSGFVPLAEGEWLWFEEAVISSCGQLQAGQAAPALNGQEDRQSAQDWKHWRILLHQGTSYCAAAARGNAVLPTHYFYILGARHSAWQSSQLLRAGKSVGAAYCALPVAAMAA